MSGYETAEIAKYVRAFSITSGSAEPNKASRSGTFQTKQAAINTSESSVTTITSCFAAIFAFSPSSFPRYCETTIAPPVASAANTWSKSILIVSTSDTPDIAASPTLDTINVSATPIVAARICSIINGIIRRTRSLLLNISAPLSNDSILLFLNINFKLLAKFCNIIRYIRLF